MAEKVGRPSAVGAFPAGASACGALDMTGNVWEWTLSSWGSFDWDKPGFAYPFSDAHTQFEAGGREALETPGFRALRGGSWRSDRRYARVSYRDHPHRASLGDLVGFRVCVASQQA